MVLLTGPPNHDRFRQRCGARAISFDLFPQAIYGFAQRPSSLLLDDEGEIYRIILWIHHPERTSTWPNFLIDSIQDAHINLAIELSGAQLELKPNFLSQYAQTRLAQQSAETSFLPTIHYIFDIMRNDILVAPDRSPYPDRIERLSRELKIPLHRTRPHPLQILLSYLLDRKLEVDACVVCRRKAHRTLILRDGYCMTHWKEVNPEGSWISICKEVECSLRAVKGLLDTAYFRKHYEQHFSVKIPRTGITHCKEAGCSTIAVKGLLNTGYCRKHYKQHFSVRIPLTIAKCKREGCQKLSRHRCEGLCLLHFRPPIKRKRTQTGLRKGKPAAPRKRIRQRHKCKATGCQKASVARCNKLCATHFNISTGAQKAPRSSKPSKRCKAEGCATRAQGRCKGFYRAHFTIQGGQSPRYALKECEVEGCEKARQSGNKGFCRAHPNSLVRDK